LSDTPAGWKLVPRVSMIQAQIVSHNRRSENFESTWVGN